MNKGKDNFKHLVKAIILILVVIVAVVGSKTNKSISDELTVQVAVVFHEELENNLVNKEVNTKNEDQVSIIKSILRIFKKDKLPPNLILKPVIIYSYENVNIEDFIESVQDDTECTISYLNSPNFNIIGQQEITVEAKDSSNNTTVQKTTLTIKKDDTPPVILGVREKFIYIGDTISYMDGVSATDDVNGSCEVSVDNSNVDLKKCGAYEVIYTATDKTGNTSKVIMRLNVVQKPASGIDINEVFVLADEVLGRIITKNMSKVEKARAIFWWVKGNIVYAKNSNKESWITGAYEGFKYRKGDCYISFAVSKALLTRVGIDNINVKEINGRHYWNMINCGNGWYHFDATVFMDPVDIFMWTDERVDSLYITGIKLHTWDRTIVPVSAK